MPTDTIAVGDLRAAIALLLDAVGHSFGGAGLPAFRTGRATIVESIPGYTVSVSNDERSDWVERDSVDGLPWWTALLLCGLLVALAIGDDLLRCRRRGSSEVIHAGFTDDVWFTDDDGTVLQGEELVAAALMQPFVELYVGSLHAAVGHLRNLVPIVPIRVERENGEEVRWVDFPVDLDDSEP